MAAALSGMFRWCVRHRAAMKSILVLTPTARRPRRRERCSHPRRSKPCGRAGKLPYPNGQIAKLLLLTGCRRNEIVALEWEGSQRRLLDDLPAWSTHEERSSACDRAAAAGTVHPGKRHASSKARATSGHNTGETNIGLVKPRLDEGALLRAAVEVPRLPTYGGDRNIRTWALQHIVEAALQSHERIEGPELQASTIKRCILTNAAWRWRAGRSASSGSRSFLIFEPASPFSPTGSSRARTRDLSADRLVDWVVVMILPHG